MCGRFTITIEAAALQMELGLAETPVEWKPRFNVAPTQPVAVLTNPTLEKLEFMRWGLVPSWAKDIEIGSRLINARSETIDQKPSFKNSFARRRCLILADGFYEWYRAKDKSSGSQPYYFTLKDHKLFSFAGIWDLWQSPEGSELLSCSIITCSANEIVKPYHERMPVILTSNDYQDWLKGINPVELKQLLRPFPSKLMEAHPVSRLVNSAHIESPQCITPIALNNSNKTLFD
jgi:putative SOS response-associated peptidase YedK